MDIKNLTQQQYDEMLVSLIPNLDKFSFKRGGEGRVYFVDENFVVKRYSPKTKSINGSFEKYIEEMKLFYELGLSVPRIYSYVNIHDMHNPLHGLYLLEERMIGRELYYNGEINKAFDLCKSFCTKAQFDEAIKHKKGELFELIVSTYLQDFYNINQKLISLNNDVIDNFIQSDYDMYHNGKYSLPDTQSCNVILSDEKLTIIDPAYLETPRKHHFDEKNENSVSTLSDMVNLFRANGEIIDFVTQHSKNFNNENRILKLLDENKNLCGKLLTSFVRKTNKLYHPVYRKFYDYWGAVTTIERVTNQSDANEILSEIQKEF